MQSWSWSWWWCWSWYPATIPPSLSPLFTSFQLLNDESLFASREFAAKQKFRWEKVKKNTKMKNTERKIPAQQWMLFLFCFVKFFLEMLLPSSLTVTFMSEWVDINWRKGIDSIQPNVLLIWQQGEEIGNYICLVPHVIAKTKLSK